ncbi:hypothetical protein NKG94_10155 [Micromonospora sp. M12]
MTAMLGSFLQALATKLVEEILAAGAVADAEGAAVRAAPRLA